MKKVLKGFDVTVDRKINTAFVALQKMSDQGYTDVTMVVGADRVSEFKKQISKYIGPDKDFKFTNFEVVSAGERDPDAEGVQGMSASKMRAAAEEGNLDAFRLGIPTHVSDRDIKGLFNAIRRGMGVRGNIKESWFDYDEFVDFAESYDGEEDTEELNELSTQARIKLARRMKRQAKRNARIRKRREKRRKSKTQLQKKAKRQAIRKVRDKLIRGIKWEDVPYKQRERIGKRLKKKSKRIAQIARKMIPAVHKAERDRLEKVRERMTTNDPAKAMGGDMNEAFANIFEVAPKFQMAMQRNVARERERGLGASTPKEKDAARKKGERKTQSAGTKSSFSDTVLVTDKRDGKKRLILAKDKKNYHKVDSEKGKVSRGSAASASQQSDWEWTETSERLLGRKAEGKKQTEKTIGAEAQPQAQKQPRTPEEVRSAKAQADLASLNVREKEIQVSAIEKEAQQQQDAENQQAEMDAMKFDPSRMAWDQPQMQLSPKNASDLENSYDDLEKYINIYDNNEGKQFEYALTTASDLLRGMSMEDIIEKNAANGEKNLGFSREMFGVAVMTLGQLPEEDRGNLYHWDEMKIPLKGEPKTDAVIVDADGNIKHTLSLKNDKGFQIQSGQGASTVEGFRRAIETVLDRDSTFKANAVELINKKLENIPTKMVSLSNVDRLRESGKFDFMFSETGEILPEYDYDAFKDSVQKDLTEEVVEVIQNNPDFGMAAIHEAMSGKQRFESMGVPEAAATHMLSPYAFEDIGETPFDNNVVAKYSEQVKCQIRARSRSGVSAPAIRLDIAKPGIVTKTGKITKYGNELIKDRMNSGDDFAKSGGKIVGFSEMFSSLFEQKKEIIRDEDLLIDIEEARAEMQADSAPIAISGFVDEYEFDISSENPHVQDKDKNNVIVINGKKIKKIPVDTDKSLLNKAANLEEKFNEFTKKSNTLESLVVKLRKNGLSRELAYEEANTLLGKIKTNEKGGAGEIGTKELLKKYIEDTPFMKLDAKFTESF